MATDAVHMDTREGVEGEGGEEVEENVINGNAEVTVTASGIVTEFPPNAIASTEPTEFIRPMPKPSPVERSSSLPTNREVTMLRLPEKMKEKYNKTLP